MVSSTAYQHGCYVAKNFLDADNILAVDMPLDMTPSNILDTVIEKVKTVHEGKGVLLLVDMGSFKYLWWPYYRENWNNH